MKLIGTTNNEKKVNLYDMKPGEVGVDGVGDVYYRTTDTITCLTDQKRTVVSATLNPDTARRQFGDVVLYPENTILTFKVTV